MKPVLLAAALTLVACGRADGALIEPARIVDDGIPEPLTTQPGDATRGQIIFSERDSGHCVLCHRVSGLEVPFQGNLGPDLSAVANRLSPAQLRLRVADYQIVRPRTVMPSYYRNHDLYQVAEAYAGAPILTAQAVEDLVAYLGSLQEVEDASE